MAQLCDRVSEGWCQRNQCLVSAAAVISEQQLSSERMSPTQLSCGGEQPSSLGSHIQVKEQKTCAQT